MNGFPNLIELFHDQKICVGKREIKQLGDFGPIYFILSESAENTERNFVFKPNAPEDNNHCYL